jgi:hypothetical protein
VAEIPRPSWHRRSSTTTCRAEPTFQERMFRRMCWFYGEAMHVNVPDTGS